MLKNRMPRKAGVVENAFYLLCSNFLNRRLYAAELAREADLTCPVCLHACDCRACAAYLKCGHGPFHAMCILQMPTPACPLCRET